MHTIAIVGRPNVGKSTLFNMLVKNRLAITHQQAGVTRDVKQYVTEYEGIPMCFFDTGGITDDGVFSAEISNRSYKAMLDADCILFMVSAEEITAEDEELISYIRKMKGTKPIVFVVNKADNEEREWAASEYYKFGIGDPVIISVLHRRNIELLLEALFNALDISPNTAEV